MKRHLPAVVLSASMLLPLTVVAQSPNHWVGAGSDNLWSTPDNWSYAFVPGNATSHPEFGWDDPAGPFYPLTADPSDDGPSGNNNVFLDSPGSTVLIDSTVNAAAYGVRVGGDRGAPTTLEITGGTLQIGGNPPNNPSSIEGWHFDIGRGFNASGDPNSTQRVIMSGGEVITNGLLIPEQFIDNSLDEPTESAPLNGELIMSGGTINARWMNLGQLRGNGRAELSGDAVINIASNVPGDPANGGHLEFNRNWFVDGLPVPSNGIVSLDISDNATINIAGHISSVIVTPDAGEVARYEGYVDLGWLTAWGGTQEPIITLQDDIITISAPELVGSPGDYNDDGTVNTADYAVWRDNLGQEVTLAGENPEAATPGLVDAEDYDFWVANFGQSLVARGSSSVPEPGSILLWLGTLGLLATHRTLARFQEDRRS